MEREFWTALWEEGRIPFHRPGVNPALTTHLPHFGLRQGACVLVPLCGKSHDMIWLLEQGYEVVGIEVSEIAVAEFFDENGFEPTIDQSETCVRWTSGRITLLQGDLLELNPSELPTVNFIYDRASLIALPLGMRLRYVRQLERLSRGPVPGLLVSMEHDRGTGPPFSIGVKELTLLYGESSTVTKIGERKGGDGSTRVVSYRIDPYPEEK